jgi:ketosteroid isomerase-like protein
MPIRPAFGVIGLLAGLLSACQPGSPGQEEAEQAIIAQEHRALEQWAKGNPLGYLDIIADDVTYFDDIGAHARVDGIDAMRTYLTSLKGKIPPHRNEILDPNVQLYGDVGILTLRYHAYGADTQLLSRWKATSVYRRVDDQWRIVHAHWSLVKDGEPSRSSTPVP